MRSGGNRSTNVQFCTAVANAFLSLVKLQKKSQCKKALAEYEAEKLNLALNPAITQNRCYQLSFHRFIWVLVLYLNGEIFRLRFGGI